MRYEELRTKWIKKQQPDGFNNISKSSYLLRLNHYGGFGACGSGFEATLCFTDALDMLGYLRFSLIPTTMDFETGLNKEDLALSIDEYLNKYSAPKRQLLAKFIEDLDRAIAGTKLSTRTVSKILKSFNAIFSDTNPASNILLHGPAEEYLASKYFLKELSELNQAHSAEKPALNLIQALKTGTFDFSNKKARSVLAQALEAMDAY